MCAVIVKPIFTVLIWGIINVVYAVNVEKCDVYYKYSETSLTHRVVVDMPTDAHHAMIRPRHRFEPASAAISVYAVRSERGTGRNALVICTPLERITH